MKTWIRRVVALVLVVALFLSLQELVAPKYASSLFEGSFTSAYYDEKADHQVLMIGDCELYENIDTMTLWDKYGITSYIRGNAQQLPWQSYYLLKEALKKEYPDVVIYSVLPLKYNEPQKEEYNRLALENMKWSLDKVAAIKASMTAEEHFLDYAFPIFRYHSRITQLTEEDWKYYGQKVNHTIAGYYMRIDTAPYELGTWGEENDVGAYTAAKLGLKTLVIEKNSHLGGTITSALVVPAMKSNKSNINCDFYNDFVQKMSEYNAQITYCDGNDGWFNPEIAKIVLDDMLQSVGCDILFNSVVTDVTSCFGRIVS